MRAKLVSYPLKHGSAPGTKSKKLKAADKKFNTNNNNNRKKRNEGVKDNRKFVNDNTISEAEKIARRIDLENIKNKVKKHASVNNENQLFSNKDWSNDPMMMKVKQLGRFDEGLDESDDDDENDENDDKIDKSSSKYFADGIKKGKKTLEDMIHESKVKKAEKQAENEEVAGVTKKVNETFRDEIRHILPKLGEKLKAKFGEMKENPVLNEINRQVDDDFQMMEMAEKPERQVAASGSTLGHSDKKSGKLVENKVDKLREKLKKAGIVVDGEEKELNVSDLESEEESDGEISKDGESEEENDSEDEESDSNEEENEESDSNEEENVENDSDEEENNLKEEENDSEDEEISEKDENESSSRMNTIGELKSIISKSNKRKLETDNNLPVKKAKINSDKNEVDCLRVLIQMEDLRKDILLLLSSKINSRDLTDKDVVIKKLILATLFQESLQLNKPYCYSPELVQFLKIVLTKAAQNSDHWLSVKTEVSNCDILNICTTERENVPQLSSSIIFHTIRLLKSTISTNNRLPNKPSLFKSMIALVCDLPLSFYPVLLNEEIKSLRNILENDIDGVENVIMRVKKQFKIVELLEADVEDKFDPRKDVTKVLKKKVKSEKKALKKDIKMEREQKAMHEIAESRKNAAIRNKKTLAILNGIHQIS